MKHCRHGSTYPTSMHDSASARHMTHGTSIARQPCQGGKTHTLGDCSRQRPVQDQARLAAKVRPCLCCLCSKAASPVGFQHRGSANVHPARGSAGECLLRKWLQHVQTSRLYTTVEEHKNPFQLGLGYIYIFFFPFLSASRNSNHRQVKYSSPRPQQQL